MAEELQKIVCGADEFPLRRDALQTAHAKTAKLAGFFDLPKHGPKGTDAKLLGKQRFLTRMRVHRKTEWRATTGTHPQGATSGSFQLIDKIWRA